MVSWSALPCVHFFAHYSLTGLVSLFLPPLPYRFSVSRVLLDSRSESVVTLFLVACQRAWFPFRVTKRVPWFRTWAPMAHIARLVPRRAFLFNGYIDLKKMQLSSLYPRHN
jgi:hypothetical protein